MRHLFLFILLLTCSLSIFAQTSQIKVKMKNGSTFTGQLKEFKPAEYVVIVFSGIETKIPMADVESLEESSNSNAVVEAPKAELDFAYGQYVITDNNNYPEAISISVGGMDMEFRLVRGGSFIMGYDDRHSLAMESEPIHKVNLSSYYISTSRITNEQANLLLNKNYKIKKANQPYEVEKWEDVDNIVRLISNSNKELRLPTEAEWEYSALMDYSDEIFGNEKLLEWCSDYYAEYSEKEQTNPKGPKAGKNHVLRSYTVGRNIWQRKYDIMYRNSIKKSFRLVVSADKI